MTEKRCRQPEKRCRQPGCHCTPTEASEYCSASCAQVAIGGIASAGCECGHPECDGDPGRPDGEAAS